jgi:hypothetical protein
MRVPTGIYWRRRLAAAGGVGVALLVGGWAIGGFFDDGPPVRGVVRNGQLRPPSTPPATTSPSAPSSSVAPSAAPASSPTGPPVAAPVPPPPQLCPDAALQVLAETGAAEYPVGQRPELRLVLVNAGTVACIRDVSRQFRELLVFTHDHAVRLWSSTDCYASPVREERVIQPGERVVFTVSWAGRTSTPGCPNRRETVPAGSYLLIGKFGHFTSQPTPFRLV